MMTTRTRLFPMLAVLAALSLVVAACGQKSGVSSLAADGSGEAAVGGDDALEVGEVTEDGQVVIGVDAEGNAILAPAGSAAAQAAAGGTTTRTGRTATGGTTATTVGGGGGGGTATTKVWGDTVMIGIHAPITGASPLPSSFQAAADFISTYFNKNSKLPPGPNGKPRTIAIKIVDDQYQPAIASQRCKEMIKQDNAFLVIGAAGTDQIQACARESAKLGVPYLSAGVTEKGLRGLKNYFAISMSYKQQIPYLVNFMKSEFPQQTTNPKKVWMVYSDTPNFGDARDAFKAAWPSPGPTMYRLPRVPTPNDLSTAAQRMCDPTNRAEVAFPLMAPKDWLILLGSLTCTPKWAGIGVTMGVNEVAKNGCNEALKPQFNGSTFFSPVPGEDTIREPDASKGQPYDAEFKTATATSNWDDIWLALWGTTKGVADLLTRVGPDLTRAGFVTSTENATGVGGPPKSINPVLNFSPSDHFGAREVHVLKADCGKGKYTTYRAFTKF